MTASLPAAAEDPGVTIDLPQVVLDRTPVRSVRINAADGRLDSGLEVRGIRRFVAGEETGLPSPEDGQLHLETEPATQDLIFVTGDVVEILQEGEPIASQRVRRLPGWASLIPPVVAVILSIFLRDVLVSLFAAVYSGAVLLWGDPFVAFLRSIDTIVLGQIAPVGSNGGPDLGHAMILLFTFFLGAMVAVMARSGGTAALLGHAERYATTRERGQVMTTLLGFLIFFDDYANALLIGGTMRPLTDRLKISRAKLAYLIDATSAPIAGLAIVSTWIGVEIGYIATGYQQVGIKTDGYTLFIETFPYRFYPLYLLVFTIMIAWSGRDFGSMRRADALSLSGKDQSGVSNDVPKADPSAPPSLVNAIVPLAVLLGGLVAGMAYMGVTTVRELQAEASAAGLKPIDLNFRTVLSNSDPTRMLYLASFAAAVAGPATALISRRLTLAETTESWMAGVKSMVPASAVLVLAWSIAAVCDPDHLNTAGYIVYSTSGALSPGLMPTLAFVVSGAVAFATGSSWSTMGLLIPLFIAVSWSLMPPGSAPNDPAMLGVVGAILAGAIFGDHCSPISDTTVLASAAAQCRHTDHVSTQLPYAVTVATISILIGYLPAGLGVSPWFLLPVGVAACYAVIRVFGRSPSG